MMIIALTLLNSLAVASILAAIAFVMTRGSRSAGTRHAIWSGALLLIVPLSLGLAVMPVRRVVNGGAAGASAPQSVIAPLVLTLWMFIAALVVLRLLVAWRRMHRLKSRAQPSVEMQRRVDMLRVRLHVRRQVGATFSDEVAAPLFAGCGRGVIVVPRALSDAISDVDLDRVLAHEVAHARRNDDVMRLLHELAKALLFFHPLVHWMAARAAFECELACDAIAAEDSGGVQAYAMSIARLVLASADSHLLAPAAVSRSVSVSQRLEALLGGTATSLRFGASRVAVTVGVAMVAIAAASPFLAHRAVRTTAPVAAASVDTDALGAEHYHRGLSLYWSGRYAEASEELRKSYDLGYEQESSAVSLAASYAGAGDEARAAEWRARATPMP
jgi:beta-lactamase regulating signal transducer with metallopeptidase domain